MEHKWIDCNKRQPKLGDEYNVVWNLDDGEYPTSTTMEWDAIKKRWIDVAGGLRADKTDQILYWSQIPKPPKGINKKIWKREN